MLLYIEGFDHIATADLSKKGWSAGGNVSASSTAGRRGGGAIRSGGSTSSAASCSRTFPASGAVIVGLAFQFTVQSGNGDVCYELRDASGNTQLQVVINNDRTVSVRRGGTTPTVLCTSTAVLNTSTWYYIELKAVISATTSGSVDLRINGASAAAASSVVTRHASSTVNAASVLYLIWQVNTANSALYDDLYIADTTGTTNNDCLGDVRVDTLLPSADGTYTAFTPSTGTSHFALVDESTPNTTDYVDGLNIGDRDSFQFADLTALTSQTIYGVQVNAAINKDDAGSKSAATFARLAGTNLDGAAAVLGTSQTIVPQVYESKPGGGAWSQSDVNSAEFGVVVTA